MNEAIKILGIAGSLRQASFNRAALRAAQELLPAGVTLELFDLALIPMFNQDTESQPAAEVVRFKQHIRAADAILIASPEYNYSMPGVLKNAIDCASRPYGDSAWAGKPVALMGASVSLFGSARAQYHLRQVFVALDMLPLNRPEVMIGNAAKAFDAQGSLVDLTSRDLIHKLLEDLVAWTRHRKRNAPAAG